MNLIEEKQLLLEIKMDPSRFSVLFDTYYTQIFSYLFHRVADFEIARDITSETFLRAFLNISAFKWKGVSFSYWLFRIANNEMNQYFRKSKYSFTSLDLLVESSGWDAADPKTTVEEKMAMEKELQKHADYLIIQKKLRMLPLAYQEVIALRYFEQKSIKEVAMILNKREGTIKSLLSRGIEKLREMI